MVPQSNSSLSGPLFQYASEERTINLSDSEGHYSFLFGMSFNENVSRGQTIVVQVFCSLLSQHLTSTIMRGVSLRLVSASASIDGVQAQGIKIRMTFRQNILIIYLTSVKIGQNLGQHSLSARLIISTINVNYLGYFGGPEQVVNLNGTIRVI